jgi:phospholipase/carboxylesterase
MPRSMLVYQDVPERTQDSATLIALHGSGGDLDQLLPLARDIGSVHLVAPQAARPVTPTTQGYSPTSDGYTWFFIQEMGHPEPATFGEGLWLVEQFIYDVRDRQNADQPTFLLGFEQGAVLSATMAAVVPDALAGVVAICGYLPEIPGWSPPMEDLNGLPVLLVHDPDDVSMPVALVEKTVEELTRRRAAVQRQYVAGSRKNPVTAAPVIKKWLGTLA